MTTGAHERAQGQETNLLLEAGLGRTRRARHRAPPPRVHGGWRGGKGGGVAAAALRLPQENRGEAALRASIDEQSVGTRGLWVSCGSRFTPALDTSREFAASFGYRQTSGLSRLGVPHTRKSRVVSRVVFMVEGLCLSRVKVWGPDIRHLRLELLNPKP